MTFALSNLSTKRLTVLMGALLLSFGLALTSATSVQAQPTVDQSYNGGAYGAGEFGSNDCLAASETTPTPTTTPTGTPTPNGLFPDTGGQLGLWAAIGALILAIGLGLYGYTHRAKRATHRVSNE